MRSGLTSPVLVDLSIKVVVGSVEPLQLSRKRGDFPYIILPLTTTSASCMDELTPTFKSRLITLIHHRIGRLSSTTSRATILRAHWSAVTAALAVEKCARSRDHGNSWKLYAEDTFPQATTRNAQRELKRRWFVTDEVEKETWMVAIQAINKHESEQSIK